MKTRREITGYRVRQDSFNSGLSIAACPDARGDIFSLGVHQELTVEFVGGLDFQQCRGPKTGN